MTMQNTMKERKDVHFMICRKQNKKGDKYNTYPLKAYTQRPFFLQLCPTPEEVIKGMNSSSIWLEPS